MPAAPTRKPNDPAPSSAALTDKALRAGGGKGVLAFIRTERSKASIRTEKHRTKQGKAGKRPINLFVPKDSRSRATVPDAAAMGDRKQEGAAIDTLERLLADEELRALLVNIAARPDVRGLANLLQEGAATTELLDAAEEARHLLVRNPSADPALDGDRTHSGRRYRSWSPIRSSCSLAAGGHRTQHLRLDCTAPAEGPQNSNERSRWVGIPRSGPLESSNAFSKTQRLCNSGR